MRLLDCGQIQFSFVIITITISMNNKDVRENLHPNAVASESVPSESAEGIQEATNQHKKQAAGQQHIGPQQLTGNEKPPGTTLQSSGRLNKKTNVRDALKEAIANQDTEIEFFEPASLDNREPKLMKQKTAAFGQNDVAQGHQKVKEKPAEGSQSNPLTFRKQLDNYLAEKSVIPNQISSQSLSCDESLRCADILDEITVNKAQLQPAVEAKAALQENESSQILQSKGAKNFGSGDLNCQLPESPFDSIGLKMTVSPNLPRAKLDGLSSMMEQSDQRLNTGAVAVASNSMNQLANNKNRLTSDAEAAKKLFSGTKSPTPSDLNLESRNFSFYQKSLSPHIQKKNALDNARTDRLADDQFQSPKQKNKHYEPHSGHKSRAPMDSPMYGDTANHMIQHAILSAHKKGRSPFKRDVPHGEYASGSNIRTIKDKATFCSPNHNSKVNRDVEAMENDARFSSNTTERYRTRCSKGSIIHSNFKINQNSLPKVKQGQQHIIQPVAMMKQMSFANVLDQERIAPKQNDTQLSAVLTPNVNLGLRTRLKYDEEETYNQRNPSSSTLFNLDSHILNPPYSSIQQPSTKFGQKNYFSPSMMGDERSSSPAFNNPMLSSNINQIQEIPQKEQASTPLFNDSVFNQRNNIYPCMIKVDSTMMTDRKREPISSRKMPSSESSSGSGSSEESSGNTNSSITSSEQNKMHFQQFMSQQSQTYKYEYDLFTKDHPNIYGMNLQEFLSKPYTEFAQFHPYNQNILFCQKWIQEQQNGIQFHFLNPQELTHQFHTSLNHHVPGCTLKCSCGLIDLPMNKNCQNGRSRTNSDISLSSPCKNPNTFCMPNFQQQNSVFQNFQAAHMAMNAFMNPTIFQDMFNEFRNYKRESHKKKKNSGKRRAGEVESSTVFESESKKQRTGDKSQVPNTYRTEMLKTPENKQLKVNVSKRDVKSSNKIQLNIESDEWSQDRDEEANQVGLVEVSKSKKSKISRTQTKREKDQFDAPDAIYPPNDEDSPQKHSDFVLLNDKTGRKKSQANTQLKTMDTLNRNSTRKDNQFFLEISPARKFDNKFNSNMKEPVQNTLFDKEYKHLQFTNEKREYMNNFRSEHESMNMNAYSSRRGQRLHQQMSVSKVSIQEKEQMNQKNEEQIRIMTDKIVADTITQEQLFKKIADQEPRVQQCMGCKCKNTKCLKLYCECLRNKATCGPACQCKQSPKTAVDVCNNNEEFKEERKNAIRDILKRNILAFEDKVSQDQHFKGCKCKNSFCQKKYCECYERNVACTDKCKCSNCKNGKPCGHHNDFNQSIVQGRRESEVYYSRDFAAQNDESDNEMVKLGSSIQPEQPNSFHQRHFDLDMIGESPRDIRQKDEASDEEMKEMSHRNDFEDKKPENALIQLLPNNILDFSLPKQQESANKSQQKIQVSEKNKPIPVIEDVEEKEKKVNQLIGVPEKLTSFNVSSQFIEKKQHQSAESKEKRTSSKREKESVQENSSLAGGPKKQDKGILFNVGVTKSKVSKRNAKASKSIQMSKIDSSVSNIDHPSKKQSIQQNVDQTTLQLESKAKSTPDKLVQQSSKDLATKKQSSTHPQVRKQNTAASATENTNQDEKVVTRHSTRIKTRQLAMLQKQESNENDNPNSMHGY